uniref:Bm9335, isoform d n=1 Tax=Brugia malayi TaxID=6279 RepID=A0A1I9G122_BRUMA|nr:Bm9335, isoform d [Brugia malayi]
MVAISLPTTISNFEGEISHVVVAGNETLTFIKPSQWQEERKKISLKLHSLAQSLKKFESLSAVKSGEVYIANVKGSLERSYIIRRPTPDTYSIYLIDKGMQCEAQFDDIYEFPQELLDFALFSCVCPVFVPSADQLNVYKAFIGHKCKCEVETISRSFVVLGYVRGRLLVENGDFYKDLQDIVCGDVAIEVNNFAKRSIRSNTPAKIPEGDIVSWTGSGQRDSSNSELTYRCSSTEEVAQRTRDCTPRRRMSIGSKKVKYGQQQGSCVDAELRTEYETVKAQPLFTQTAFKQYKPDVIPTVVSVRFDKKDRVLDRFWVVNKSIFSTVERVLKENSRKISGFPVLRQTLDNDILMRKIPCVVRTRAESAYKAYYRAVPSRFDARTKRCSIFLVDFGWFKWVLAKDVIDISAMDKSNPIRNLPVAMIHCQEDVTSVLHAKNLSKGADCYMRVKESLSQDVYLVDLLETGSTFNDLLIGGVGDIDGISSSKNLANETYGQQFMTSMMLGTLNTANRDLTQSRHIWPFYCSPAFPMIMPVALPVMVPVPVPNANLPTIGHEQILNYQNSQIGNIENTHDLQNDVQDSTCFRNYVHERSQNSNSRHIYEECYDSNFSAGSRLGFMSCSTAGNSLDEDLDGNSHRVRLTSWEKAVAADRALRTQAREQRTFHEDDESSQLT